MKHKATNRLLWLALALLPAALLLCACEQEYTSCPHEFNGESCPSDCVEVEGYEWCTDSSSLLGCAVEPQRERGYPTVIVSVVSRADGRTYGIDYPYLHWARENSDRFCMIDDEPVGAPCPEPDQNYVDACEARE